MKKAKRSIVGGLVAQGRCLAWAFGLVAILVSGMTSADEGGSKTLRIALFDNMQPLAWIADDGRSVGVFVEIWKLLGERIGRKVQFIPSTWPDSLDAVRKGDADILSVGQLRGELQTQRRSQYAI